MLCCFLRFVSIISERSVTNVSDNLNVKEEDIFPWKKTMRQAGQGDTGSVLRLCEEIRPIVEGYARK